MKQVTFAYSFQGSSHIKKEENSENRGRKFPCQDRSFAGDFEASEIAEKKEVSLFVKDKNIPSSSVLLPVALNPHNAAFSLVCVSDGHGGAPYFKSQKGAEFAIQTAIEMLSESIDKIALALEKKEYTRLNANLSTSFVRRWIQKVMEDVARTDRGVFLEELNELKEDDEKAWKVYYDEFDAAYGLASQYMNLCRNPVEKDENKEQVSLDKKFSKLDIKSMYGCTIAVYFRIKETPLWYAFKVGDSDILMSFDEEYIKPIADDPQCYENVTTSLCNDDVVRNFCFPDEKYLNRVPKTILCSSDGVANSFTDEEFLKKFYTKLQFSCDEDGPEKTASEIKETLPLLGKKGSGDDISLAGIISYDNSLEGKKQRRESVLNKAAECSKNGNYDVIEGLFKPYLDRNDGDFRRLMAYYDYMEARRLADIGVNTNFLTQWNKAYSSMTCIANDFSQRNFHSKIKEALEQLKNMLPNTIDQEICNRFHEITYNSINDLFRPFIESEPNIYSFYKVVYEYKWIYKCYEKGLFMTFHEAFYKITNELTGLEHIENFNFIEDGRNILRKMLGNMHKMMGIYWYSRSCIKGTV